MQSENDPANQYNKTPIPNYYQCTRPYDIIFEIITSVFLLPAFF